MPAGATAKPAFAKVMSACGAVTVVTGVGVTFANAVMTDNFALPGVASAVVSFADVAFTGDATALACYGVALLSGVFAAAAFARIDVAMGWDPCKQAVL